MPEIMAVCSAVQTMTIYVGDAEWQFVSEHNIFEWVLEISRPERMRIIGVQAPPYFPVDFFVDTAGNRWVRTADNTWIKG